MCVAKPVVGSSTYTHVGTPRLSPPCGQRRRTRARAATYASGSRRRTGAGASISEASSSTASANGAHHAPSSRPPSRPDRRRLPRRAGPRQRPAEVRDRAVRGAPRSTAWPPITPTMRRPSTNRATRRLDRRVVQRPDHGVVQRRRRRRREPRAHAGVERRVRAARVGRVTDVNSSNVYKSSRSTANGTSPRPSAHTARARRRSSLPWGAHHDRNLHNPMCTTQTGLSDPLR